MTRYYDQDGEPVTRADVEDVSEAALRAELSLSHCQAPPVDDDPWHSGEAIAAANAEHGEPF